MFKEKRFIWKGEPVRIRDEQDLYNLCGHFPPAMDVGSEQIDDGPEVFEGVTEVIVFVDPKHPEEILDNVEWKDLVEPYRALFAEQEDGSFKIPGGKISIPVDNVWGSKMVHIAIGGGVEGSPDDDEYLLPYRWRDAFADNVGDVLGRVMKEREDGKDSNLAIYLDGKTAGHANAKEIATALGRAIANMRHRNDMLASVKSEHRVDGRLKKPAEDAEAAEEEDGVVDEYRTEIVRDVGRVLLLHDLTDNEEVNQELKEAFKSGDLRSRMQSLVRAMSEVRYDIMKCKQLATLLVMLAEDASKMGKANFTVQLFVPDKSQFRELANSEIVELVDFTELAERDGIKLSGLNKVHQGSSPKDVGPIGVIVKYEHPDADKGEEPGLFVGKGIVKDTGGQSTKPAGSQEDMHADMGGAAMIGALIGRLGESQPKTRCTLSATIASNMVSNESYDEGEIVTLASGRTALILSTDAEGRIVLVDLLTLSLFVMCKEELDAERHEARSGVTRNTSTTATLTGAACVEEPGETPVVTKNIELGRAMEDYANAIGEGVVFRQRKKRDATAIKTPMADAANVTQLKFAGRRVLGVTSAAEFLAQGSGMSPKVDRNTTHFDIADGMTQGKLTPHDLKDAEYPMEVPVETAYQRLIGRFNQHHK